MEGSGARLELQLTVRGLVLLRYGEEEGLRQRGRRRRGFRHRCGLGHGCRSWREYWRPTEAVAGFASEWSATRGRSGEEEAAEGGGRRGGDASFDDGADGEESSGRKKVSRAIAIVVVAVVFIAVRVVRRRSLVDATNVDEIRLKFEKSTDYRSFLVGLVSRGWLYGF